MTTTTNEMGAGAETEVRERFRKLMRSSMISASKSGNPVLAEFARHFDADPSTLPYLQEVYPDYVWINRQTALNMFLARPGVESTTKGVVINTDQRWGRLADMLLPPSYPIPAPRWGQVGEEQKECGYKEWMTITTHALIFFKDENGPGVFWINGYYLEVMAPSAERAFEIMQEIRRLGVEHSPYRGQCVNVFVTKKGVLKPQFERRPQGMVADEVILPPGLLERVEEHVIEIARHTDDLLEAKRHLKRGLLLWGRPGTGKTHTIRYLASQLPDHTILILPGSRLENLHRMILLIELCVPGVVVLDDVDFIAEDRSMPSMGAAHNLNELLETLDGMAPDADLLFILTTNRADTIEPAVAARPGRVDQVAEIPPPDDDCRRRLFDLYSKDVALEMDEEQIALVIKRTDGVTGSFFKEMLRRAVLAAADESRKDAAGKLIVTNDQVIAALDEMTDPDHPMTARILGREGKEHAMLGAEDSSPAA